MSVLSRFIAANRRVVRWFEHSFAPLALSEDPTADQIRFVRTLIDQAISEDTRLAILEVGGADRPLLPRSLSYSYDGVDPDDRPECYSSYDSFLCQTIELPLTESTYDLIISNSVLEHVMDNTKSAQSMFGALRPGGIMIHYIPSRFHPYAIVLKMLGHKAQRTLIRHLKFSNPELIGYRAYFSHCSPSEMTSLLTQKGFEPLKIACYYTGRGYLSFFFPAYLLMACFEKLCQKLQILNLCSGFLIVARRPYNFCMSEALGPS